MIATPCRRARFLAAVAAAVWLLAGVVPVAGLDSEPFPPRSPWPYVGPEPWSGFRLHPREATFLLPLAPVADTSRWEGWRGEGREAAYPPRIYEPPTAPPPSPALTPAGYLEREPDAFREGWHRGLEAAERGDADACWAVVTALRPVTVEGAGLTRELAFAAAVAREDRAVADSLFYRISWEDGGRTATRLAVWRYLDDRAPEAAARQLDAILEPSLGERAVDGFTGWMRDPEVTDTLAPEGAGVGAVVAAVALLRARDALVRGRSREAREALAGVEETAWPAAWVATRDALARLAAEEGDRDPGMEPADVNEYHEAARAFMNGEDERAREALDRWLVGWPASPHRPQAFLLRGQLHLAAGRHDAAGTDLAASRRTGEEETAARANLALAFLAAARGRADEATAGFDQVLEGPLGYWAEAELLFDRARLVRLLGDEVGLGAILLTLEEGFPDEPWAERARVDTVASGWTAPWRVLPPEPPRREFLPPAPELGPWGGLLWGDDALPAAAARLRDEVPVEVEPVSSPWTPPPSYYAERDPVSGPGPKAFVAVGGGGPAALITEAAVGAASGPVLYRVSGRYALAGQSHGLPDLTRWGWEAAASLPVGAWSFGVVLEGLDRRDDEASAVDLHEGAVDAAWNGFRGQFGYRGGGETGITASVSRSRGELETADARLWRTDQTWLGVEAALDRGAAVWEGELALGRLDQHQPDGTSPSPVHRDLRVARRVPGRWYLGLKAAQHDKKALVLPVAGVEQGLGSGLRLWAATEPEFDEHPFRTVFVTEGDWNVPDLGLGAERRWLDLRAGLGWDGSEDARVGARVEITRTDEARTWMRDGGLWRETALDEAKGSRVVVDGAVPAGAVKLRGEFRAQSVRAENRQVPYVPRYLGWLDLEYASKVWRLGLGLLGTDGREDEEGNAFGSFLRWDVHAAYRLRGENLPLGARWLEFTLRIENLTDVQDRRWPGVPGYGIGVYGGVQTLFGD